MRSLFVHEMFVLVAERHPDRVAIESARGPVTYRELHARTSSVAASIASSGVGRNELVVIFAEDRQFIIEAILSVLKAGAAFVPLSPTVPAKRLEMMLAQCQPKWAIVQPHLAHEFQPIAAASSIRTISVEDTAGGPRNGFGPLEYLDGEGLSYIFFTSGSTGKPKAIAGRLKGIDHFIRWEIETFGLGPGSRVSQLMSPMFDAFMRDIFAPLCSGGTVCIPDDDGGVWDGAKLGKWIEEAGINLIHTIPSVFRLILNQANGSGRWNTLHHVLLSGEPLLPADVKRWHEVAGGDGGRLVNLYGPTETTMTKFVYMVQPDDQWKRTIPIGKPMKGAKAIVVGKNGKVCPPWRIGELYIRTPYRSLGYFGQPELTNAAFVPNPFSNDPTDLIYKTGDLARIVDNGDFEVLGRQDNQVKMRGVRIEIEEIEAALAECEGVSQAAVAVHEESAGERRLAAYVVPENGAQLTSSDLRGALKDQLPEYMLPSSWVLLQKLPLTPSGKVDRQALKKIRPEPRVSGHNSAAASTQTEEILCGIWLQVLKLDAVGAHDNFFEIGGHSLLATQLMSRIRDTFSFEFPLQMLFESPTIAQLAVRIKEAIRQAIGAELPPIQPVERNAPLPLSYAQQRLWFMDQLEPGNVSYNIHGAVQIEGPLDAQELEKSLQEIVRRHESLRTHFISAEVGPQQVIDPETRIALPVVDLTSLPQGECVTQAKRLALSSVLEPFDLRAGSLLRAKLFRLEEQRHVLVLVMHHIVSDAWSLGLLEREVSALYGAFAAGQPSPLPELPIQYADFSVWQRRYLNAETLDKKLVYWKQQLAGLETLELPADRPRPAVRSRCGANVPFNLPPDLPRKLKELGLHETATLYMLLLAAFQVLLFRYTNQTDLAVGSPVAGRLRSETENLIGCFINTLVLRTDLAGDPTFTQLLRRIKKVTLDAFAQQDVPFEKLVETLQPERNLGRTPLFQAMFVLQNAPRSDLHFGAAQVQPFALESNTTKFDLTLVLGETSSGLSGILQYSTDLFEASTVERMAGHYEALLTTIVSEPQRAISELPLLTEAELQQLLVSSNQTSQSWPSEEYVHRLIEQQAARTPEALAVEHEGRQLTYAELNSRSNQLARYLSKLGVGPEARVGIFMERRLEMIAGLLAVLKVGGAYIPLDPGYPTERVGYMLADSAPVVVLTTKLLLPLLPQNIKTLCIDDPALIEELSGGSLQNLSLTFLPDHPAYVIYTSGSTGTPKAVVIPYGALLTFLHAMSVHLHFDANIRHLAVTTIGFDISILELFLPLCYGASVVLASREDVSDAARLCRLIRSSHVNSMQATPSHWSVVVEEDATCLKNVRVLTGGEALARDLAQKLFAAAHGEVYNLYGPTEATVWASVHKLDVADLSQSAPSIISIGKPLANYRMYVLDHSLKPLPFNVIGDLYIAGAALARGYLNSPALTAERFVADPYAVPGARMYRTGDLARWRANGRLEFLGRADQQVKIRGFRIELGEVEAALRQHPVVDDVVVVLVENRRGKQLAAYFVSTSGPGPSQSELRQYLSQKLPDYMIPGAFMRLDKLPVTPNGKVDRKALPAPEKESSSQGYEAPQGEIEQVLAGIWQELLDVKKVGRQDHFFDLGGHSLLAVRLLTRVRQLLGVELAVAVLFERPTLTQLAAAISEAKAEGEPQMLPPITTVSREAALPLSFSQQRLWLLGQMPEVSATYHIPMALRLRGELDRVVLRLSLNRVLARHEALRSVFATVNDQPHVELLPEDIGLPMDELDLSGVEGKEERVRELMVEEARAPFDLAQGPLVRARLIRLQDQEHVFLLTHHHIVSDGWSIGVFAQELRGLYQAYSQKQPDPLPRLAIQYPDYAAWQRQWLNGDRLKQQSDYWRQVLTGAPVLLELPTDRPRPQQQSFAGAYIAVKIDRELTEGLKRLSRQQGATLFMTLLSAWAAVLSRLSGQRDVVIGITVANRRRQETEPLIGIFVNMLALRIGLSDEFTVEELLKRVRERALEAQDHQDLPFEQVVEIMQPPRHLNHTPLFQVVFAWQNNEHVMLDLPGLQAEPVESNYRVARFDQELALSEQDDMIVGTLNYATSLFDEATIKRHSGYLLRLLKTMVADSQQKVAEIELPGAEERVLLLENWNATEMPYPEPMCIHQLFEEQVRKTPQAAAVIYEEQTLSYAELNRRANQLAHFLISRGVRPDQRVAICMEPSAALVVGLLGIMKAGAAYIPLDSQIPAERLKFMLQDSGAAALVSNQTLLPRLPAYSGVIVTLGGQQTETDGHSIENPPALAVPDNLAYVIYTSGSTGTPKGVAATHRGMVNRIAWMARAWPIAADEICCHKTSLSFDDSVAEIFAPLLAGARLVVAPDDTAKDAAKLVRFLDEHGVTRIVLVPSLLSVMLTADLDGGTEALKTLRIVVTSGESLPMELANLFKDALPHATLLNLYGNTEDAADVTYADLTHRRASDPVLIGKPIANRSAYVLDDHMQPCAIGAIGELYVGGVGLARGYVNRSDLTAEKFVPDPFSRGGGKRLYRTGDLTRWRATGELEFIGRKDHQTKLRGHRIELGEIEARMIQYPGVREAAVVVHEDRRGEKRLLGYVVPRGSDKSGSKNDLAAKTTFSLFYFGAGSSAKENKYDFFLKSAKFADLNEFEAIWTPERHFHNVGNLYPNPATLNAALATITSTVKLRAGSVVLPLHDPIRVAEEWAVVDNLSNGRAGVAIASGWHPRDFSLFPQNYSQRKQVMLEGIETLKSLWRGETIVRVDGKGSANAIRIFPEPIQSELPLWITSSGNPDTFIQAGKLGANVLTHLLGQSIAEVAMQITRYRIARAEAGHDPATGRVTLMIHTFMGEDLQETLRQAKAPFMSYMQEHLGLMEAWAKSLNINVDDLRDEDKNIAEFAFERYSRTASLIGTPQACLSVIHQLQEIGVDEIACLIDWIDAEKALNGLPYIKQLYDLVRISFNRDALRNHLLSQLPEYMVPAAFVTLDALPRTTSGKLDRNALPIPDNSVFVQQSYEPPQDEIEQALAVIWAEMLDVERVGRNSNFFQLGGHSLLAVRLLARVRQAFGVELPMVTLFAHPTVAQMAEKVRAGRTREDLKTLPPITPVSREGVLALSSAQQRLWFLSQMNEVSVTYHIPTSSRIYGDLDTSALRRSLNTIFSRHEALRSVFVTANGEPHVELLAEEIGVPLMEHDLRGVPEAEERLRELVIEEVRTPFDLTKGPLIRGRLIRLAEQEHVFVLIQHHIVSDGWSLAIFMRELSTVYRAFSRQQPNPLPPLAIQYPDYAAWQRRWLSAERMQQQDAYWRETLADAPALLELPTDRPRPAQQSFAGSHVSIRIGAELTQALRQLSNRNSTTLFMTLLSAWAAVLSRLSAQETVVIGTAAANRNRSETEELIGFFVNTLALRIDLSNGLNARELLEHVRERALAAQDHQDLPFEQVVEIVQPPRRLGHTPLFQAMFAWQINGQSTPELSDLRIEPYGMIHGIAKFDLELGLWEQDDGIAGNLIYATALFDEATMQRHIKFLLKILESMASDIGQEVAGIDLLEAEERTLLLQTWNATETPYPEQMCIHQLFEEQVRKAPQAVAALYEDRSLSYAELNRQANQLAHYLIGLGIKPQDRVAICMERCIELIVSELAVIKCGAVYVPMSPADPKERRTFLLSDCEAKAALSLTKVDMPETFAGARINIDEFTYAAPADAGPAMPLDSQAPACIMYTSGSTGRPKGVIVPHRAISRLVLNNGYAQFLAEDRVAFAANPAFDASTLEVWGALLNGARIVVIDQSDVREPARFGRALRQHCVSILWMTASLFHQYADPLAEDLAGLRYLIVGGEALNAEVITRTLRNNPPGHLLNGYGPTESTTFATTYEISAVADGARNIPIGRPIANTRIYLLDEKMRPVPLGAAGEIYIGGAGVALGYLNRPELTAERFLNDPFSAAAGTRMYKTGDLARYLPDGNIEFLGRKDQQVKIRGFRIELGEIETRLAEHALVREAVVLVRENAHGEKHLVAHVVLAEEEEANANGKTDGSPTDRQLPVTDSASMAAMFRAYLAQYLPEYMVPAAYVRMDSLPLTPNGKLNRNALPLPEESAYAMTKYEAPQGDIEKLLARIWSELLGVERIGRHDNFFELGGHSLLALKLIEQMRKQGLQMDVRTLFGQATLMELAATTVAKDLQVPPNLIPAPGEHSSQVVEVRI